jgi:hypothetical protein
MVSSDVSEMYSQWDKQLFTILIAPGYTIFPDRQRLGELSRISHLCLYTRWNDPYNHRHRKTEAR